MKEGVKTFENQAKNGAAWFVKLGALSGIKSIIEAHSNSENSEIVEFTKELTDSAKAILSESTNDLLKQYAPQF